MLLFGGGTSGAYFGDTWTWDGATWTQRWPAVHPSARFSPAMATDLLRGRIVLFGGQIITGLLQDTWIWDGSGWAQLATPVGPPAMYDPSLNGDLHNGTMVLFGTRTISRSTLSIDTWLLINDTWWRDPRPMSPTVLGAFSTFDIGRSRMVLFGGMLGDFTFTNGTWEYDVGAIASWTPFGAGCTGSAGLPTLRARSGSQPVLGSAFALELANVPGQLAAFVLGTSDQLWNGRLLPLGLSAVGMPGCTLLASPDTTLLAAVGAGRATCSLSIPATPSLTGLRFFAQGLALDPTANALGIVASDAGAGVLGPF
jgi:hypothetical protein